ncbi:MAG TPA: HD-GYP domain-containing protein [Mycobacteriales bacterium]|nr:HD-GYP domain-containing protein [Mycobacteriales bacterium]
MAPRPRRQADRWDAHPVLAWWVRVGVLLVPLAVSVVVALGLIAALPEPHGGWAELGWWVLVVGASFGAAQLVDRVARRALPLAVLLRLSLVFPDRAPSRLRTARRTSLREIELQVASLHAAADAGEPAAAARTLVALVGALGLHDKRTRGHSERVRAYVDMLTEQLRLPEEDRARLRWAALLHDIGKLSVPQPVLNGGTQLTEHEWGLLRQHPVEGERLAAGLLPWLGEWGRCVREHHERWDGSGYPAGLRGQEISLGARIVAVADAYEVMTANRSYHAAVGPAAAREELARCAGTDFDPAVVRAFLQIGLGRLRGVLGPLSLLPALPFAAAADRAGQAVRGLTTMAAVSTIAVAASGSAAVPASAPDPPAHVALSPVQPAAVPTTPAPTPTTSTSAPRRAAPARPQTARAVRPAAPRPTPRAPAVHVRLGPVLYLTRTGLGPTLPTAGAVSLRPGTAPAGFGIALGGPLVLDGVPHVVLVHRLVARHGAGHPRAALTVVLQDCDGDACRTLARATTVLDRAHAYLAQRLALGRVRTVLPAGHELRLAVSVSARDNVDRVLLAYGGSQPSRLDLG